MRHTVIDLALPVALAVVLLAAGVGAALSTPPAATAAASPANPTPVR